MDHPQGPREKPHDQKIEVAVTTTSGSYPEEGYNSVPENQKVEVELRKAVEALKITDTSDWIAEVNGREIDIQKSYKDNNLTTQVIIDFRPSHGGGGNE